ncbi:hypothetical protein EJ03DRAFT_327848 [Teratosphaeria nubilosa]|uniref:Glycosyltransferase family 31 protein n=1 Tax=Teratosphaeria nubilosa TaxID=161662 RepID=A0A6G1L8J6_9PEZI|nr:hypothetical protein EJ03DRAFT_327848 [Teratosphaeria nubilosa]
MSANLRAFHPARLATTALILAGLFLLWQSWLPQYVIDRSSRNVYHDSRPKVQTQIEETVADHDAAPSAANAAQMPDNMQSCKEMPGAENVMIILKTGATELYQKLPVHFLTTFTCTPNFMLFSDMEQNFSDYPVYDAIAPVTEGRRAKHEDFELYRKLLEYKREGQDMSELKGDSGWNLDKWKFLPMLHKAFLSASDNIEWFVMIEADTSLAWANLLLYLKTMDPKKPYYTGAQNNIGPTTFAHGGSGVVFSRAAADTLEAERAKGPRPYDEVWEERTAGYCCGDGIVAEALLDVGIPLTPAWPLIQGETVSSIDWTDNHWCAVAITWHHVTSIEIDAMWQFQKQWVKEHGWDVPFLHRDVFNHFVKRHIGATRTAWNNISKDLKIVSPELATGEDKDFSKLTSYQQKGVESAEACAAACKHEKGFQCIQWMWTPGRCHLGKDIRFGQSDEADEDAIWTSGWMSDRIAAFEKKHKNCKVRWEGV